MGMHIFGWVEVAKLPEEDLEEDYAWQGLIDLFTYLGGIDEATEILFGYSKRMIRKEYHLEAIAKDRGMPANPCVYVKRELENVVDGYFGYTHIYLNEILAIDWSQYKIQDRECEWFKLIDLLKELLNGYQFEAHKVRIVVWFYWP